MISNVCLKTNPFCNGKNALGFKMKAQSVFLYGRNDFNIYTGFPVQYGYDVRYNFQEYDPPDISPLPVSLRN